MKWVIFGITGLPLYNSYHNEKDSKYILSCKKYIQIAIIGLVGGSLYFMIDQKLSYELGKINQLL